MLQIKVKIKNVMKDKNTNILALSKKTHMNKFQLYYLLYFPYSKIKLSQHMDISRALGVHMSELL